MNRERGDYGEASNQVQEESEWQSAGEKQNTLCAPDPKEIEASHNPEDEESGREVGAERVAEENGKERELESAHGSDGKDIAGGGVPVFTQAAIAKSVEKGLGAFTEVVSDKAGNGKFVQVKSGGLRDGGDAIICASEAMAEFGVFSGGAGVGSGEAADGVKGLGGDGSESAPELIADRASVARIDGCYIELFELLAEPQFVYASGIVTDCSICLAAKKGFEQGGDAAGIGGDVGIDKNYYAFEDLGGTGISGEAGVAIGLRHHFGNVAGK